jgi:hypothetical protein
VKLTLTKKRGSISLRFKAETGIEGVDLKNIVLGAAKNGLTIDTTVDEFRQRGYSARITKDTPTKKEFTLERDNTTNDAK